MRTDDRIFITGHAGMVGSALLNKLKSLGYNNIIVAKKSELDLRNQSSVLSFFEKMKPDYLFILAARVGGIKANMTHPAEFLYDNLMIEANLIHAAYLFGVKKVMFLGSSCIYPKESPQPMREDYLLTGPLEPTNEGYAIAKIAGLKMVEFYHKQYGMSGVCPMPSNLYGPGDSFDPDNSHVLSALVKKFVDATVTGQDSVIVWGTGIARREFLHVHDLVDALLLLMEKYDLPDIINVGSGYDISIKELAEMVARLTNFKGVIEWDTTKPNGMLKKCMDISKIKNLGFSPKVTLEQGITEMIESYKKIIGAKK